MQVDCSSNTLFENKVNCKQLLAIIEQMLLKAAIFDINI